jgi:hypothetical protein
VNGRRGLSATDCCTRGAAERHEDAGTLASMLRTDAARGSSIAMTVLRLIVPGKDDLFSDFEAQADAVVEGTRLSPGY